jgi:hypothetical protein
MRLLMVNVGWVFTATPVALFAGLVEVSLNELAPYEPAPAVNVLVKFVRVLPSTSTSPLTATVYTLFDTNVVLGTKVRVTPSLARLIVPVIGLPFEGVNIIEELVIDVGSMAVLITATITAFNGTSV